MPYVWFVTVNYRDGSSMCLRFSDTEEQKAFEAWLEQTKLAKPHNDRRPRVGLAVSSVDPPRREFVVDRSMEPVLQRSYKGIVI